MFIGAIGGFIALFSVLFIRKNISRSVPKYLTMLAYFAFIWTCIIIIWAIVGFIVS
jgi:hypothetical protein